MGGVAVRAAGQRGKTDKGAVFGRRRVEVGDQVTALAARAETILTMNLRDFPASALAPHGVAAVHPDNFLCGLCDADLDLLRASTEAA